MRYQWKYDESLGPTTPGIKHASLATLLRTKSTKYALSVKVQRSSVAHNSKYQTCEVLGLTTTVSNMRYRLKRFWGPDVRYRWKFVAPTPSIKHALSAEVWRRFCGPKVPNMRYRWKCGEVLWPLTPAMKHALASEDRRGFWCPKVPETRYR